MRTYSTRYSLERRKSGDNLIRVKRYAAIAVGRDMMTEAAKRAVRPWDETRLLVGASRLANQHTKNVIQTESNPTRQAVGRKSWRIFRERINRFAMEIGKLQSREYAAPAIPKIEIRGRAARRTLLPLASVEQAFNLAYPDPLRKKYGMMLVDNIAPETASIGRRGAACRAVSESSQRASTECG